MTIELTMLAWAVVLGFVHIGVAGMGTVAQHGPGYGLSPRDERRALTGIPGRLDRALVNFGQTFPFFAAAVLIAHAAGRHDWLTAAGVQLYFWARLVYLPLYAFGVPVARTLAFIVANAGIVLLLLALI